MKESLLLPMIDIPSTQSVNPLADAIREADNLAERPDLILRLVDLIFLFEDDHDTTPS